MNALSALAAQLEDQNTLLLEKLLAEQEEIKRKTRRVREKRIR